MHYYFFFLKSMLKEIVQKLMSPQNKVARLWEGVGVGVLVEVARDE